MNIKRTMKALRLGLPSTIKSLVIGVAITAVAYTVAGFAGWLGLVAVTAVALLVTMTYLDGSLQLDMQEKRARRVDLENKLQEWRNG
jgi:hypothetical protein